MQPTFKALQSLSVRVTDPEPSDWYSSVVLDFTEGKELLIGLPIRHGVEISVPAGTRLLIQLILPDGVRRMTTSVRERRTSMPAGLVIEWPQSEERIQRRNDVRVDTMFPAEVRPIMPEGSLAPPIHGLVADISAGGARLFTAGNLYVGAEVELTMQLPSIGQRQMDGRVVRGGLNVAASTTHPHWIGVMFTDVPQTVKRDIIRLVFDLQREQMRRG